MAAATTYTGPTPGQQTAIALTGILAPLVVGAFSDGQVPAGAGQPVSYQPAAAVTGGVTTSTTETLLTVGLVAAAIVLAMKFL